MSKITRISVRMYQVGFGDCFLVSFEYDGPASPGTRAERHMLIDFGRNRLPYHGGNMEQVAKSIKARCNGDLDVIVVTHRHEDHLSAFGQKAVAKVIGECSPRLIVRSWTENPEADTESRGPALAADRRYLRGLRAARSFTARLADGFALDDTTAGHRLKALAATEVANQAAVDQLRDWGLATKADYLHFGMTSKIGRAIPGATFEVLGPPTPTQFPDIAKQADDHPEEFWHLWQRRLGRTLAGIGELEARDPTEITELLAATKGGDAPGTIDPTRAPGEIGPERWLTEKIRKQQLSSLLRIVTWLDEVMNNTSLVLLIRAGDRRLLFSGDAQLESWKWITQASPHASRNRTRLAQVDLYKVGHHGSRNATPKTSLYKLWARDGGPVRPVVHMMSTRDKVYGETDNTFVPNPKLVTALAKAPMRLISTLQDPKHDDKVLAIEVAAPARGSGGFKLQPPILRPQ